MRIVGGRLRGRRLAAPADDSTRPTTDRVRESLFNILESRYRDRLMGGRVGDFFAGTGALGIEALSRGADHATFIEQSPAAFRILKENIKTLGLEAQCELIRENAHKAVGRLAPFDIIFLDPPYGGDNASGALSDITTYRCIKSGGIVVLEAGYSDKVGFPDALHPIVTKRYGNSKVIVMEAQQ